MGDLTTLANVRGYMRREFDEPAYTRYDVELTRTMRTPFRSSSRGESSCPRKTPVTTSTS